MLNFNDHPYRSLVNLFLKCFVYKLHPLLMFLRGYFKQMIQPIEEGNIIFSFYFKISL